MAACTLSRNRYDVTSFAPLLFAFILAIILVAILVYKVDRLMENSRDESVDLSEQ